MSPHESTLLHVTYLPRTFGACSLSTFVLFTPCGRNTTLTLRGKASGCTVSISSRALGFGDVQKGKKISRVLYIENSSPQRVPFQIMTDPFGVFSFDCTRGIVPPSSSLHITICFQPQEEANYWKRVTCLFQVRCDILINRC